MIDYGVKAPTEQVIVDNLVAAKLMVLDPNVDDGGSVLPPAAYYRPVPGVSYVFLGRIQKTPPTYAEDGETVVTEATFTTDAHADLRFDGPDATSLEKALKSRTLVSLKADPVDGAPATEGREDGFKIYPHGALKSPSHRYWGI